MEEFLIKYLFWVLLIGFIGFTALVAWVFAMVKQMSERVSMVEKSAGIQVKPFWLYAVSVVGADLIHPHKRYKEMDGLVQEALLEPLIRMPRAHAERLNELLDMRSKDFSDDMRPGERNKAKIFKLMLSEVRREAESDKPLIGLTMVGSMAPDLQVGESAQQEGRPQEGDAAVRGEKGQER